MLLISHKKNCHDGVGTLLQYLTELVLVEMDTFLKYPSSLVAAAALCLANITLDVENPWVSSSVSTKTACTTSTVLIDLQFVSWSHLCSILSKLDKHWNQTCSWLMIRNPCLAEGLGGGISSVVWHNSAYSEDWLS